MATILIAIYFLSCLICVLSKPECLNGGTLDELSEKCKCPEGFEGKKCQRKSCVHGRRIEYESVSSWLSPYGPCICENGWTGEVCEWVACAFGSKYNKTHCLCHDGYEGPLCDHIICLHGDPGVEAYNNDSCFCHTNWTGTFCNTIDCVQGEPKSDGVTCRCYIGWHGDLCDKEEDTLNSIIMFIVVVIVIILCVTCCCCAYKRGVCCRGSSSSSAGVVLRGAPQTLTTTQYPTQTYSSVPQNVLPSAPPSAPQLEFKEPPPPTYEEAVITHSC